MKTISLISLTVFALTISACGDPRSLIQETSPLNGSTAVDYTVKPVIEVTGSAGVDVLDRKVVLYEITGGAKLTVGGDVEADGPTITYFPSKTLKANAEYALEVKNNAITGDEFDKIDASEGPVEENLAFTAPVLYRLHFSTRSCPRVRAAYHQIVNGRSRIIVRFSQKMSTSSTSKAIAVMDNTFKKQLTTSSAVFTGADNKDLYVDLTQELDRSQLYILWVKKSATSADNTGLDGNANWKPGESTDEFYMKFTGQQAVIFSRLQTDTPSQKP